MLNASNNAPVPSALVTTGISPTLTTNGEGYANVSTLPSEEVVLNVTAAGFATGLTTLWLAPGVTTSVVVGLVGVAPATVDVRVTNSAGVAVSGAIVNLTYEGHPTPLVGTMDSHGWANYSSVPASSGTVTAWAPGDHTEADATFFGPGATVVLHLSLVSLVSLDVHVTGLLPNGTVSRLQNASIFLAGALLGVTDPTGELNVSTLAFGGQRITASAPYFQPNSTSVILPESGTAPVYLQLVSAPPADLDLTVLSSAALLPVPSATINFTKAPPVTTPPAGFSGTTARGILLTLVARGQLLDHRLGPGLRGEHERPDPVDAARSDRIPDHPPDPAPQGGLHTIVLDNSTHDPIPGAVVAMIGVGTLVTDPGGWANFTGLGPGTYDLIASANGYLTNETALALAAGQVVPRFPINLTPAHSGSTPGGQNSLALLPPDLLSVWPLLLLPFAVLALAVVYLTLLRAPVAPPPEPAPARPATLADGTNGSWRRRRRNPPTGDRP